MELTAVIALLCVLVVGVVIGKLYQEAEELKRRVTDLEKAGPKRLPYEAIEKTEDVLAALIALEYDQSVKSNMLQNAIAHAQALRNIGNGKK
jgi:hypothetical protein